ncbi:MAG: acyl-CoA synthetase FdrA [Firmicutes bacterium]|nr:acyl-CoA synthetase FdrA [Bacillota bacterium]
MAMHVVVRKNTYQDSVKLMQLTEQVKNLPGISRAAAIMGTENNKATLVRGGFNLADLEAAGPNDVLFLVEAETKEQADAALDRYQALLDEHGQTEGAQDVGLRSLGEAEKTLSGANLALISVPGEYAALEAFKALRSGMNVHIFSDNVPVEQEVRLKKLGQRLGLLVMGPDCGTSIIGGVPVCFANEVASGAIGIVGASGTGIQQVTVLIDRLGSGISHAIGTGGRDLSDEVGGITVGMGLDYLESDPQTKVIVLVSKPPGANTGKMIVERVKSCTKPVVLAFLGGDPELVSGASYAAANLEEAAAMAVALESGKDAVPEMNAFSRDNISKILAASAKNLTGKRRYIRGLYTGGSLADEALLILGENLSPIYSNIHHNPELRITDFQNTSGHVLLDLGDDQYTLGRPHPMIDPSFRAEQLLQEWADPEVAVILCDVVLGHGSHPNPAAPLAEAVKKAREQYGESVTVVASVCGTEKDPQVLSAQESLLTDAGVLVLPSNAYAAQVAGRIISEILERSD